MFDLTTEDKLFKEYIIPGVVAEIMARSKLFERITKNYKKVDVSGKYAKQKLLMAGSQATSARSTAEYPTAQESTPAESIVYIKRAQMFQMKFDGLALESAAGGGTPLDPFDFEQKGLFIQLADDLSRQLMLDGSGHLAQVNGAVAAATTVTVDSPYYANATLHLKAARVIDIDPAHTGNYADAAVVDSITDALNFETTANITVDDDDWIYNEGVYTATEGAGLGEMMGLDGIIRTTDPPAPNASAGLQGLLVATYPEWVAYQDDNSGTPRDLTEVMITKALDEVTMYAKPTVLLANHGVRRFYADLLTSYKAIHNQTVLWGGWSGLPFYYDGMELPMVADKFVPDGSIYIVSEGNLTLYHTAPKIITFEKGDAGKYLQKVAGWNQYVAEGHFFGNMGTDLRRAFGVIKDLNEK